MSRDCANCGRSLPATSYTAAQYSQGPGVSRCSACIRGGDPAGREQIASEASAGRQNNAIEAEFTTAAPKNPFASGAFRWVAKGKYTSGEREGEACVCKWFKTGQVFSADFFSLDIKAVDKALEIVHQFNQLRVLSKPVIINVPEVWTLHGNSDPRMAGVKALIEPFIDQYRKFNSNTGWADNEGGWPQAMQALSHFSYHITDRQFVLCDLQGGIYAEHIILSGPAILSKDREYGVTDLGSDGVSTFFSQHTCNRFCRAGWKTPSGNQALARLPVIRGTSMMSLGGPPNFRGSRNIGPSRLR